MKTHLFITILSLITSLSFSLPSQAKETPAKAKEAKEAKENAPQENAIMIIRPYFLHGTWVFDDEDKKLKQEPFVAGVPEIINALVADIPNAKKGFRLTFSAIPFPGHEIVATRGEAASGGFWYQIEGTKQKGWLCPAMFKYFAKAPQKIYVKTDAITE